MEKVTATQSSNTRRISSAITRPANTTQYTANDAVSDATGDAHHTFTYAGVPGSFTGEIKSARITSSANQATKPDLELWLFHTDITDVADNAALALTDAETLTLVGIIPFPVADFDVTNSGSGADGNVTQFVSDVNLPYVTVPQAVSNSHKQGPLYGQLIVRNAYTPVSAEVFTVELTVAHD